MEQVFRQIARTWALSLGLGVLLASCAAPPEMAYPSGQGKKPLAQVFTDETPKLGPGQPKPQVMAHDAPDIQRLSEALAQLQAQISEAQAGGVRLPTRALTPARVPIGAAQPLAQKAVLGAAINPALNPAVSPALNPVVPAVAAQGPPPETPPPQGVIQVQPPAESQVFQLEPGDTTLLGVLLRWARQSGWQMRLNGTWVDGQRFPQHPVPYADVALERSTGPATAGTVAPVASAPGSTGGSGLEPAVAALLQAHSRYQHQLSLSLSLLADKAELQVNSQAVPPLAEKP